MRSFLTLLLLVGMLAGIDAVAFGGRFREAIWQTAKHQADQFNQEIKDQLSMVGL